MFLVRLALILLIIFSIFRIFARYAMRSFVKNAKKQYEDQQNAQYNKKEGDVTINRKTADKKIFKSNDGDYVDYEELKE